jgi:hypothetical protein
LNKNDPNAKVSRIASLTLVNAMLFQQILAERDKRVEPLARSLEMESVANQLKKIWELIKKDIDYVPIFTTATEIVTDLIGVADSAKALRSLGEAALKITGRRAALRHDLMGRIYHRLLADAKYFGAFYTTVPAASLLLKLTLDTETDFDWSDLAAISKLRIADLACGTGTLLKATLQTVTDNHVRACTDVGKIPNVKEVHRILIEEVLWGLDVVPTAIHLAGAALALHEPDVEFKDIHLTTLPVGGPRDYLGSLELIHGRKVAIQADLYGAATAPTRMTGKGDVAETLDVPSLDLCVMNPPFTRSVGGNLLFGHAPKKERARMQTRLKKIVQDEGVPASITAGLGSVFVAIGHKKLNATGRMSLVLPRALLSGIAWTQTRMLLGNNYHVEYIVVSHQPDSWNFSENTELSECLIVGKWVGPGATEEVTKIVNLWRKPASSVEALTVAALIRNTQGAKLDETGTAQLRTEQTKYGEIISWPSSQMIRGNWNEGAAFAQTELCRTGYYLARGQLYMPGEGLIGKIPITRLKSIADVGPDRRDIADGFNVVNYETEYPAFMGHDTAETQSLAQKPNKHLAALAKKKKGRPLRDASLLWSRAGRLLVAERLWLITTRLVAIRLSKPVLSNTWWPVATYADGIDSRKLDKVLALWFNSTLGLLSIISSRVDTRGAWIELKKPTLEAIQVLDPRKLSDAALQLLCDVYDEVSKEQISALPDLQTDEVRAKIDRAIAKACGINHGLDALRMMLAAEPIIAESLPDDPEPALNMEAVE